MKINFFKRWKLMALLAALPVVAASIDAPTTNSPAVDATATPPAPAALTDTNTPTATTETPTATPPEPLPAPADIKLSPATAEVVKLAQAGTDEPVMLAFITNMQGRFNLGSDQIVYLNDLGLSGVLVKAMLDHDNTLNTATAPPAEPTPEPPMVVDTIVPEPLVTDSSVAPPPLDVIGQPSPNDTADYPASDPNYTVDNSAYQDGSDNWFPALAPYGNWIYVSGYGRCWQPTVTIINHNWRPYGDRGRWLLTDDGWYWQSDYSWGWAPFHYGRWFFDDRNGWVWLPGSVWGPAWVSWRSSDEYYGWAPLPPAARFIPGEGFRYHNRPAGVGEEFGLTANRYTFVPARHFTDKYPARYHVTPGQVARAYSQTAVINNVTVRNNTIVNRGIDPKQVAAVSPVAINRVEIRDLPAVNSRDLKPDRTVKVGATEFIMRPQLPPATSQRVTRNPQQLSPTILRGPNPPAAPESYPRGSLVVTGRRPENAPVPAGSQPSRFPNMNLANQPQQTEQPSSPMNAQNSIRSLNVAAPAAEPAPAHYAQPTRPHGTYSQPLPDTTSERQQYNYGRVHDYNSPLISPRNIPERSEPASPGYAPARSRPVPYSSGGSYERIYSSAPQPANRAESPAYAPPVVRSEPVYHAEPAHEAPPVPSHSASAPSSSGQSSANSIKDHK